MQDSCFFNYDEMSVKEIQMTQRLNDLRRRYLLKQEELKKLQRRKKSFDNLRKKRRKSERNAKNQDINNNADGKHCNKKSKLKNGESSHENIIENNDSKNIIENNDSKSIIENNDSESIIENSNSLPDQTAPQLELVQIKEESNNTQTPTETTAPCLNNTTEDRQSTSSSRKRKHCKPKRLKIEGNSSENNGTSILSPLPNAHENNKVTPQKGLRSSDLIEGLQLLMLQDDNLLHPGTLTLVHPPDLYGVLLESERRRNRPIVLCQEEVFNKCIENKIISSDIPKGTRIAAYWSKTMNCLYKGHVSSAKSEKGFYDISFDDGDLRVIPQEQIRYLPPGHSVSLDQDSDDLNTEQRTIEPLVLKSPCRKLSNEKSKPIKPTKTIAPKIINCPKLETDRSFWQWAGPCHKCTENDRVTKTFYDTLTRNNETIRRGECAVFLSAGRPSLPYVGVIESMWESWGKTMVVRVRWFYHPEETIVGRKRHHGKNALYKSSHIDENDVQTISHVCSVLSYKDYKRKRKPCDSNTYYCAGSYDPINGKIQEESD